MTSVLRLGTRGSPLALAQAGLVKAALEDLHPGLRVELETIRTSGDRFVDRPLAALGGKGLFVKEIEDALLRGDVDLAVHSMKDLPAELAAGLVIAAVPPREDARDVIIGRTAATLEALPEGARLGTTSLRRAALARALRPDLRVEPLRGNVETRLRKLREGALDAIIVAAAGLARLRIEASGAAPLDPIVFTPAIGQGALAIETRADAVGALVRPLDDAMTRAATAAERAFMRRAGGSCMTPLAAHGLFEDGVLIVRGVISTPDGRHAVRGLRRGARDAAAEIGATLAQEILDAGGGDILQALGVVTA